MDKNENNKTNQVRLRALEPEDLDFLYMVENDESLWEVGCTNVPYSRQVLLDYITSATADIYVDKQVRLMIENGEGDVVGMIDLMNFDPRHLRAEMGIVIKNEFCGMGLASSAIRHLLQYTKNILHLHQIYAIVADNNENAVKMLQRVGFQGDMTLRGWLCDGDKYRDAYFFQYFL